MKLVHQNQWTIFSWQIPFFTKCLSYLDSTLCTTASDNL